ncbi:class I adenylate-forming enzyme family protein [Actinophytocola sp. NPDC049390]|uniref:class I adenylate-forming enzyme family protein n=1 Tax=Actinophytocola sp. NPDC049390 TaxID=3363894 RepID=UPI0037A8CFB3
MRIENLLRQNAVRRGDQFAVIADSATLTWAELDRETNRLAHALIDRGHVPQERVALVLANDVQVVIAYHGLWKANLVTVGINAKLTVPEMRRILVHSGASAVICDSPVAVEAAEGAPSVRRIITVGDLAGGEPFDELVASGSPDPVPEAGSGTDLRSLRYTSGTTGAAKGCMATHEQQLASTANYLCEVEVPRGGPTWISMPLSLGVGASFVTTTAYLGVPLLLRRRFTAESFVDDVERYGVVHAFLVPTMLVDLVAALPGLDPARARTLDLVGYGGAPVSWTLIRSLTEHLDLRLYHAFGATEAGGFTALLTPEDHQRFLRTDVSSIVPVGRPAAFAEVKIFDERDREVAVRETGEMRIRAASVFSGYWCQPEATQKVLKDGWLRLGDMAWRDEDGYLYLADRAQGVIRSGAQNVYAGEVEAVLQSCPGVHRAAVIGVPDERYGEAVKALVQRVPGSAVTAADVLDHCAAQLAKYKRPREVEFVDTLPVDEGGKIRRAELTRGTGMALLGTKESS